MCEVHELAVSRNQLQCFRMEVVVVLLLRDCYLPRSVGLVNGELEEMLVNPLYVGQVNAGCDGVWYKKSIERYALHILSRTVLRPISYHS